jgi:hypothetical protein
VGAISALLTNFLLTMLWRRSGRRKRGGGSGCDVRTEGRGRSGIDFDLLCVILREYGVCAISLSGYKYKYFPDQNPYSRGCREYWFLNVAQSWHWNKRTEVKGWLKASTQKAHIYCRNPGGLD